MAGTVDPTDITTLSPLILGGATLKQEYNENPSQVPIVNILKYAFSNGINAIDTSPYYGPSEAIYGDALDQIRDEFPRNTYFICTKVGRIQLDEFDYSREHVRFSVKRSCERLRTDYLNLVYLHDIEFVPMSQTLEALKELKKLKDEGIIKNFGLSGYPVDYLRRVTKHCFEKEPEIGPLDAVLSYCNLNLQNMLLKHHADEWKQDSKLKSISNGSILAMSLLRSQPTLSFHPCSQGLRTCADNAARYCEQNDTELADLANKFALSEWLNNGPTVIGVSNLDELKAALSSYSIVKASNGVLSAGDKKLIEHIQSEIFGKHLNETWPSGIEHPASVQNST
ncbi:hypothetical protein HG535_0C05620 [Zygotorulaspora mrakii]|uniref:NADP-dependent oxidoreductase domain-containing protein n=1 Tax=Zygotorulaspora mrakii TaxID=42260 RepID=A0A7H9B0P4_ZYGMR|nr:uncharacterized protein HG535_0C05620 [Zygotorulaspora mrakii]QLG72208.1 hypothetical protein HG535_0C05620 [Zygotorulaspora mrakii]